MSSVDVVLIDGAQSEDRQFLGFKIVKIYDGSHLNFR